VASNPQRWSASRRVGATPAGGRYFSQRRGRPVEAAHRSWPYTAVQISVFDEVFTCDIEATWRTYFAHLGRTAGNDGG
jgi:hypothetical protein